MNSVIVIIAVCLTLSLVFGEICYRLRYPRIIGPIVTGIVLGLPPFKQFVSGEGEQVIGFLSEIGIVFLLLLAGLEVNIGKLKRASRDATVIALSSSISSFLLGFGITWAFFKYGVLSLPSSVLDALSGVGSPELIVSLVVGASLALTAEGTSLAMLIEMNALNTRIGTVVLATGIFDDVFEILFLSSLIFFVNDNGSIAQFPLEIMAFVGIVFLIWELLPRLIRFIQKEDSRITTVSTLIVITFIITSFASMLGLSPIIGAFIAGLIIQLSNKDKDDERMDLQELKVLTFSLVVPFFFINIGLHFDPASIMQDPLLVIALTAGAFIGMIAGAVMVTPFTDLSLKQTYVIGWVLNSRGAMELVLAELARKHNLLTPQLFTAVVVMAIVTTLLFPVMFKWLVSRWPKVLESSSS